MGNGDLRYGHCHVCGTGEVYQGEYAGNNVLRAPGTRFGKKVVFNAYVCAGCGYTQLHMALDEQTRSYIQQRLNRVPTRSA